MADRGGGISEDEIRRVWRYGYTTIQQAAAVDEQEGLGQSFGSMWSEVRGRNGCCLWLLQI